jgi:hypothetical protein
MFGHRITPKITSRYFPYLAAMSPYNIDLVGTLSFLRAQPPAPGEFTEPWTAMRDLMERKRERALGRLRERSIRISGDRPS